MIRTDGWHESTTEELRSTLGSKPGLIALALFGSALQPDGTFDPWSDLDVLLVVENEAWANFYPRTDWLPLGEIYASQQSENAYHATTRICLADFRRLDFVITTESKLMKYMEWQHIPFWRGTRLLFSRSTQVTQLLGQELPAPEFVPSSLADLEKISDQFWFKAMLAAYKIVRDDRLIALHLTLELVRDCCVLGMLLRDRAAGTNVHRTGGIGNALASRLESAYKTEDLLTVIEQSAIHFDQLATAWSPDYRERRHPLLEWLEHIRRSGVRLNDSQP